MNESNDILDFDNSENVSTNLLQSPLANAGKRFQNYLIDWLIIYGISFTLRSLIFTSLGVQEGTINHLYWFFDIVIAFFYFLICEQYWAKTIGKFITKTRVIDLQGNPASLRRVLTRMKFTT